MKQITLPVDRITHATRHFIVGFAVMALACTSVCGCATTSSASASTDHKSSCVAKNDAPDITGPDYYSSSDNPFHAD